MNRPSHSEIIDMSIEELDAFLRNPLADSNDRDFATNTLVLKKLDNLKKPHWSVTPAFWVGSVAMVAACIAAYPVLFPQPQAQQSSPVVDQSVQIIQSTSGTPASSPLPLQHLQAVSSPSSKR